MKTKNKCGYGTHINLDISFCRYYLCHCSEISTCIYKRERGIGGAKEGINLPPFSEAKVEMTMDNVLPCPFCGSKPFMVERKCDKTKYGIGCSNIECILFLTPDVRKRELHNYVTCYVRKKDMIEAWNRRPLGGTQKGQDLEG